MAGPDVGPSAAGAVASIWPSLGFTVTPGHGLKGRRTRTPAGVSAPTAPTAPLALPGAVAAFCALAAGLRSRAAGKIARRAWEDELGVQPPLGYWDPLGLGADGDFEEFYRRREAELKNGRVAMYATIGYIVPEYYKFPGYISPTENIKFVDVPNGLQAIGKVPPEGWLQIAVYCGWLEILVNQPKHPSEPGNYYRGRLGLLPMTEMRDPDQRAKSMNAEIANGRLAMMAIVGMWFQDGLTGSAWGDWDLYTDSP
eukprot:CAMPEP_0197659104 /NCGR_PEP_ID=MMETSP1338-20131121/46263_1 /TAXON_ID=43686 ORGANISM="Pelagodinium beii, Strain RCC1491" /NCGR_SAMPLE_ID=MMETSP1338 /ASSEMBLY_ACC=CAM_ASM_000754 /LENGTH=254 /DNA_ID=CAMNT_0043235871 /DNA_START=66 /DNA_END=828 /DNA_ORIENTATION=-